MNRVLSDCLSLALLSNEQDFLQSFDVFDGLSTPFINFNGKYFGTQCKYNFSEALYT
jgi:hypothetical protein